MPIALPVVLVGLGVVYYFVNPLCKNFPIQCPWRLLTHTSCPACGFQRALHALLQGDFLTALSYNYFFIISIPFALLAVLAEWYNYRYKLDPVRRFIHHRYTLWTYIAVFCAWWVVRNVLGV